MTLENLYARDSKGRIKVWKARCINDTELNRGIIITEDGLLGGKLVKRSSSILIGKNIGKSNETTPFVQACNEMNSKWRHKQLTGYKTTGEHNITTVPENEDDLLFVLDATLPKFNTDKSGTLQPMRAQPYYKTDSDGTKTPKIKFPCYGQPKINGVRCFAIFENDKVVLKSKSGLVYSVLEHIEEELKPLFIHFISTYPNKEIILDGELYIHGYILSDIKSAVTKRNLNSALVTFEVFDLAVPMIKQVNRLTNLRGVFEMFSFPSVNLVPTIIIPSDESAQICTNNWIIQGFEGGIFRDENATYKFGGRPSTMTKLKRKESAEFRILDVIPMKKKENLGMFKCINNINEHTFTVVAEGTHEQKAEYLDNKLNYIGKMLTVEFYERTKAPKSLPFHAVGITIRDYE